MHKISYTRLTGLIILVILLSSCSDKAVKLNGKLINLTSIPNEKITINETIYKVKYSFFTSVGGAGNPFPSFNSKTYALKTYNRSYKLNSDGSFQLKSKKIYSFKMRFLERHISLNIDGKHLHNISIELKKNQDAAEFILKEKTIYVADSFPDLEVNPVQLREEAIDTIIYKIQNPLYKESYGSTVEIRYYLPLNSAVTGNSGGNHSNNYNILLLLPNKKKKILEESIWVINKRGRKDYQYTVTISVPSVFDPLYIKIRNNN